MDVPLGPISFERLVRAVAKVKERLTRAVKALEAAGVPHAVVGGHAVASWVTRADEGGVRNTPDVDILVRRADHREAVAALVASGFQPRIVKGREVFVDGPEANDRDAVHLIFANEKIRSDDACPAPDVAESEPEVSFRVISLAALIRMKLTANRLKDKVHILDMIEVGLIDQSTVATVLPELAPRLQELIDNPDS